MQICHAIPDYLLTVHYITVIMLVAHSKRGNGNDLYFQVTDDVSNFELVFPSMQVLMVEWFSVLQITRSNTVIFFCF